MKAPFPLILGINATLVLTLAVVFRTLDFDPGKGESTGYAFALGMAILIQFFANSLLGWATRSHETKQRFFLAGLLTLLIGFGACVGGVYSY